MNYDAFRKNPAIDQLAKLPYWTLTKSTDKMPIDINKFFQYVYEKNDIPQYFYGATEADGNNPFMDLDTLHNSLSCDLKNALDKNIFPENIHDIELGPMAFRLTVRTQPYVVLDIEPKASDDIKNKFLNTKFLYCETSMSGKGLHMIFEDRGVLAQYPYAAAKPALKSEDGSFEILINHFVTFTGENIIHPTSSDDSYFYDVFSKLAADAKPPIDVIAKPIEHDLTKIYNADTIINAVKPKNEYSAYKSESDPDDRSKNDFSFTLMLASQLIRATDVYKNNKVHEYTQDELIALLYVITKKHIPHRDKHDRAATADGYSWLENCVHKALYIALHDRKE